MQKKWILIIASIVLAVALAIAAVFIVLDIFKNNADDDFSSGGSFESSIETSSEPKVEETIVPEVSDNGIGLVVTSPSKYTLSTTESTFTFTGTSDPAEPLTLNGNEVERGENGIFSITVNLNVGKNSFVFSHKGNNSYYTINYRYVVMNYYYPSAKQTYSSGSTFAVTVRARKGSSVYASFNGQTIYLTEQQYQDENAENSLYFTDYGGSFQLPNNNLNDMNLGKIVFGATYEGKSESFSSGDIICKKPDFIVEYDPNATPLGGRYINVGSGKITEIISYEAETFDAYSTNDWSRPTNNYLPKGTVDYSLPSYVYYKDQKEYAVLRCGLQVYTNKKNTPNKDLISIVKEYAGTLPDHNEIKFVSMENGTQHTKLTLDVLWKAPFYFDILPQAYTNPSQQDYSVSSVTSNYVDITFCYATVFEGEVTLPEDNPIFSSAKVIQNQSDYTLRLYFKKQGAFYGWDANYNEQGQLVFEFLNPAKVVAAENEYKADLTGVEILIDVGHGGVDGGAPGFSKDHNEAIQNLLLAKQIKAELESIGATVYLTRDDNYTSTNDSKIRMLKELKPDYCLAIHHNSNVSSSANGFEACYSHSFSKKAAELVYMHTQNTGIYKKGKLYWHYYYMARSYYCPVVLTENGFMSNQFDYGNIIDVNVNLTKAKAITKGIAEYFLSIQ